VDCVKESEKFLRYWFKGFSNSLSKIDEKNRQVLLGECGKACSQSYSQGVYEEEYKKSKDLRDFLNRIKNRFRELEYEINNEENRVIIRYKYCTCDLARSKLIESPYLCDCSHMSLLYNWERIIGEGKVSVEKRKTLLNGDDCCEFEVQLH